jgi:hypothetical protein
MYSGDRIRCYTKIHEGDTKDHEAMMPDFGLRFPTSGYFLPFF